MERVERVNQLMKREISVILQKEFQDPKLMLVTVIGVEVTRDLQHAVVYYSVLGNEKDAERIAETLTRLSRCIRKLVGQRIRMRTTPELRFLVDRSAETGARLEKTFEEIHQQERGAPTMPPGDS